MVLITMTLYKAANGSLFFSPCLQEVGGEPPAFVKPARKYEYTPKEKEPIVRNCSLSPLRRSKSANGRIDGGSPERTGRR
jgi:hypothetical protein